jgi:hypothetical protein
LFDSAPVAIRLTAGVLAVTLAIIMIFRRKDAAKKEKEEDEF